MEGFDCCVINGKIVLYLVFGGYVIVKIFDLKVLGVDYFVGGGFVGVECVDVY